MGQNKTLAVIMAMLTLGVVNESNPKISDAVSSQPEQISGAKFLDEEVAEGSMTRSDPSQSDDEEEVLDCGEVPVVEHEHEDHNAALVGMQMKEDMADEKAETKSVVAESVVGSKSSSVPPSTDDDDDEEVLECGEVPVVEQEHKESSPVVSGGVRRPHQDSTEKNGEERSTVSEAVVKKQRLIEKGTEVLFPIKYPTVKGASDDTMEEDEKVSKTLVRESANEKQKRDVEEMFPIKIPSVKDTSDDMKDDEKVADVKADDMQDEDVADKHEGKILSPAEALEVSLMKRGKFDLDYILRLLKNKYDKESIYEVLKGDIFVDPENGQYVIKDEYLSGNVRRKLSLAEKAAETNKKFALNVEELRKVMPRDLTESEVHVKLGAPWVSPEIIKAFIADCFKFNDRFLSGLVVSFDEKKLAWKISYLKSTDFEDIGEYSTDDRSSLKLLEDLLNQRDTVIFTKETTAKKKISNPEKTAFNQFKQKLIEEKFQEWIWSDPVRRASILKFYNEKFNFIVRRKYSGDKLQFRGMNPEIVLRDYQKDAIAQIIYGGNTLLAHSVGAGKTYEICAAAMTMKQMGLSKKNLIVVPNHLIEQWAKDFVKLYPGANLLVATSGCFSKKNMYYFLQRMRDEKHDAIIISLENFSKIPTRMPNPYAEVSFIQESKEKKEKSFPMGPMILFEDLGIDRLFIDEAHNFKNYHFKSKLMECTKFSSKKAVDFMTKVCYLNEKTHEKGVILATATAVSNSIDELFTLQVYLQPTLLKEIGLFPIDNWILNFGNIETCFEFSADGVNIRPVKRISNFHNVPELLNIFFLVANVKNNVITTTTSGIPSVERKVVQLVASDDQKRVLEELIDRAKAIYEKRVPLEVDNMLKVTNDAKKLALEQRLFDPTLPVNPNSKYIVCARKIARIYHMTRENKSAQIVFCDMAVLGNKTFDVYTSLKDELVRCGVKDSEIAFIHSAKNDAEKEAIFQAVRDGEIRVLIGSTEKMGTGTNVQTRLIALHHLDCPWKPSDLSQREGRIIRFGNMNKTVAIFRYITEGTFDKYLYQLLEHKQRFISQILNNESLSRNIEFSDDNVLSYEEFKLIAAGESSIKEKVKIAEELKELESVRQSLEEALKAETAESKKVVISRQLSEITVKIKEAQEKLAEVIKKCEEEKRQAEEEKTRKLKEQEELRKRILLARKAEMKRREEMRVKAEMKRRAVQPQRICADISAQSQIVYPPVVGADVGVQPPVDQPYNPVSYPQSTDQPYNPAYYPQTTDQSYDFQCDPQYDGTNPGIFGDTNVDTSQLLFGEIGDYYCEGYDDPCFM